MVGHRDLAAWPARVDGHKVMARFDAAQMRRYYDEQTPGVCRLGQGGGEGAIHRAVWGPGVPTASSRFTTSRIASSSGCRLLGAAGHRRTSWISDAASAAACATWRTLALRGTGITLSPVQARLGSGAHRSGAGWPIV